VIHAVQLFDSAVSRSRAVAAFVRDGIAAGDRVVVMTRMEDWTAAGERLLKQGVAPEDAMAAGRLVLMDAEVMLAMLFEHGAPDQSALDAALRELVRMHTADGLALRFYGDMVDLLAARGDFATAQRFEQAGNAAQTSARVNIFCGYTAPHFTAPHLSDARGLDALRAIRRLHTHVHLEPADVLSTQLMHAAGA
jgi:hypothetical protein